MQSSGSYAAVTIDFANITPLMTLRVGESFAQCIDGAGALMLAKPDRDLVAACTWSAFEWARVITSTVAEKYKPERFSCGLSWNRRSFSSSRRNGMRSSRAHQSTNSDTTEQTTGDAPTMDLCSMLSRTWRLFVISITYVRPMPTK